VKIPSFTPLIEYVGLRFCHFAPCNVIEF
jgi:hypothetical protein